MAKFKKKVSSFPAMLQLEHLMHSCKDREANKNLQLRRLTMRYSCRKKPRPFWAPLSLALAQVVRLKVFCHKKQFENDNSAYYSSYIFCHLSCYLKFWVGSNRAYQISRFFMLSKFIAVFRSGFSCCLKPRFLKYVQLRNSVNIT